MNNTGTMGLPSTNALRGSSRGLHAGDRRSKPWILLAGFCVPLTIGGATFAATMLGTESTLRADDSAGGDQDGDGLHDVLESGLALAADRVDTDGDGWNDAEELARRSLPHICGSTPEAQAASVGAQAYVKDGKLHFAVGVYRQNGSMANLQLELGIFFADHWIPLSVSTYADKMTISVIPTSAPGELLLLTDVVLPQMPLIRTGAMSMFAILRIDDQIVAADAIDLILRGKTPLQLVTPQEVSPHAEAQLGTGLLYRPLGGAQVPPAWSAGEICFQGLDTVGSHGAVVTQEVTSASCISGW